MDALTPESMQSGLARLSRVDANIPGSQPDLAVADHHPLPPPPDARRPAMVCSAQLRARPSVFSVDDFLLGRPAASQEPLRASPRRDTIVVEQEVVSPDKGPSKKRRASQVLVGIRKRVIRRLSSFSKLKVWDAVRPKPSRPATWTSGARKCRGVVPAPPSSPLPPPPPAARVEEVETPSPRCSERIYAAFPLSPCSMSMTESSPSRSPYDPAPLDGTPPSVWHFQGPLGCADFGSGFEDFVAWFEYRAADGGMTPEAVERRFADAPFNRFREDPGCGAESCIWDLEDGDEELGDALAAIAAVEYDL